MKIENKTSELKLDFFRSLYMTASDAYSDSVALFERAMAQYRGSAEIDGSRENAITVRNITYEIVESQVSSDIPAPKTDATSYSERRERNAVSIERLCRSLRDRLPFEEMNDIDERYTYIYGGSVYYADWDNSSEYMGEVGGVKVMCLSPLNFIPQPGICNIDDMEYCFLKFTTTRGELSRKYGVDDESAELAEFDYKYQGDDDGIDTVNVITCFYRDENGEIGRFIFSGDLTLSDLPEYYKRKRTLCTVCGNEPELCKCKKKKHAKFNIDSEDVPLIDIARSFASHRSEGAGFNDGAGEHLSPAGEKHPHALTHGYVQDSDVGDEKTEAPAYTSSTVKINYYVPKSFPIVIRKNTSTENSLYGQSDCDYIRPEQQAINKIESRILQKLLRAAVTPIVPEDARIAVGNSVFGQVIKMKPGESAAQYGKVDTTPDISQDIAEAERLYDHAKRVIGISDAYQGIDTGNVNESGVAKQLRINQATGRLESKRKMKHTAYARLDRIIFTLYLAFADEPRRLSYKDAYGRVHNTEFNRRDFIEADRIRGGFYYDDAYLFSVDLNGGNEYQRESMWQRNLENLKAGTLGNPEDTVTLLRYWQCQERAHYPHARENVEYFSSLIKDGGV